MTPSNPWGDERGQLSLRLQVRNQILGRRQARRLSRRFARVGVSTPPRRLQQMLAGAPVTYEEVADVNFALIATLVLVTLNFLFCMAYALFSLTLEASPW
jgi:hypothetical protein